MTTSRAMVTVKTAAAPATNVCAHPSADTSRSERSAPMTRKPAIASARKCVGGSSATESCGSDSCGGIVSRAIISADQTKLAALITNSTGTPVTASSSPAMAGPMKKARLSSVLLIAFAAVSSCGELASRGSSAASAGRNGPAMKPTITARVTTDQRRTVEPDQDRCDQHQAGPQQVRRDQERLLGPPVDQRGQERQSEGHQQQPGHRVPADVRRAALLVEPDGDRGVVRPVADHRPGQGQVDPPQVGVGGDEPGRGRGSSIPAGSAPPESSHRSPRRSSSSEW